MKKWEITEFRNTREMLERRYEFIEGFDAQEVVPEAPCDSYPVPYWNDRLCKNKAEAIAKLVEAARVAEREGV